VIPSTLFLRRRWSIAFFHIDLFSWTLLLQAASQPAGPEPCPSFLPSFDFLLYYCLVFGYEAVHLLRRTAFDYCIFSPLAPRGTFLVKGKPGVYRGATKASACL
jgi:hypothetical protein